MSKKICLDQKLKELNLVQENLITPMIMAGEIWVNNQKATSHAQMIDRDSIIEIKPAIKKYVSRGAYKLEKALQEFNIDVKDKICADFGSSTGGFTDVLIKSGAAQVFAIETGKGLLDIKLRNNPKVVVMEGTGLFDLNKISDEKIDFAVCDLSFVPLEHAIPKIFQLTKNAPLIALLKPHYEAQDESLLRNGIVKDEETRNMIVERFKNWLHENNFKLLNITESPIKGGGGNIEYLVFIELA